MITQRILHSFKQFVTKTESLFCTTNPKNKAEIINLPPSKYTDHHLQLKQNTWRDVDLTGKRSQQTHLSNAEQLIKEIPIINVSSDVVRCIGGTQIGSGHPQVYIQVNTNNPGEPVSCKYCGLRYSLDNQHH